MKYDWHELFKYLDGNIYWRTAGPGRQQAKPAGTLRQDGYRTVEIGGKKQRVHRIIWEMHFGPVPKGMLIDHIDADPRNNKIENLRLADPQRNATRSYSNSNTGWKGVQKRGSRYQAVLQLEHGSIGLGVFDDVEDAALMYNFVAAEWFGSYARYNEVEQPWLAPSLELRRSE